MRHLVATEYLIISQVAHLQKVQEVSLVKTKLNNLGISRLLSKLVVRAYD